MNVRRTKPYVCVDCDYAEHFRFQETNDLETSAGTWLRCLAHSRAQEQDGVVKLSWLKRTFAGKRFKRVDELVRVGLLHKRDDGDYEIHAYAPRNQTKAMIDEDRAGTRQRMAVLRQKGRNSEGVTAHIPVTSPNVTGGESARHKSVSDADVPTSTSTSTSISPSSSLSLDLVTDLNNRPEIQSSQRGEARRGDGPRPGADSSSAGQRLEADPTPIGQRPDDGPKRNPLPPSERSLWGNHWLTAFTDGISGVTGRPCTGNPRFFLDALERIVALHAPDRAMPQVCEWIGEEATSFARKWKGTRPPSGLTPDGLERWLSDGRPSPPQFGKPRIVQPTAEEWHEDDYTDLGARS